jgi:ankyrin repeat protein
MADSMSQFVEFLLLIDGIDNEHFDLLLSHNMGLEFRLFQRACDRGNMEMMVWLHEEKKIHEGKNVCDYSQSMIMACCAGRLDVLKYLVNIVEFIQYDKEALRQACLNGHLNIVEYLHRELKFNLANADLVCACKSANLELVKYMVEAIEDVDYMWAFESACSLEIANYLFEKFDIPLSKIKKDVALTNACASGNVALVKYLVECLGLDIADDVRYSALKTAFSNDDLEMVQYLVESGQLTASDILKTGMLTDRQNASFSNRKLKIMTYLFKAFDLSYIDISLDFNAIIEYALRTTQLNLLKFLHLGLDLPTDMFQVVYDIQFKSTTFRKKFKKYLTDNIGITM